MSYLEADPTLNDYYTTTGKYEVLELDRQESREKLEGMSDEDRALRAIADAQRNMTGMRRPD